jgi:hypothetical protein
MGSAHGMAAYWALFGCLPDNNISTETKLVVCNARAAKAQADDPEVSRRIALSHLNRIISRQEVYVAFSADCCLAAVLQRVFGYDSIVLSVDQCAARCPPNSETLF